MTIDDMRDLQGIGMFINRIPLSLRLLGIKVHRFGSKLIHSMQWRIQKFRKGGPAPKRGAHPPKLQKNSRILGLKF
jgi:hypothetical protein